MKQFKTTFHTIFRIGLCQRAYKTNSLGIIIAIFLAAILATTETRLISVAIADLRGQFFLDNRESAALVTALNSAQLISMTLAPWAATVIGFNRTLLYPTLLLGIVTFLIPFVSRDYSLLLLLHGILGFCIGVYLPLTISLALRHAKPNIWLMIMAAYSLRVSIGMDSGMGISGFLIEEGYWQWIYWISAVISPFIAWLFWKSIPLTPIEFTALKEADWLGMILFTTSLVLIFIGFEGGERFGWQDSKVVVINLLTGGGLFLILMIRIFFYRESFGALIAFKNQNILFCLIIACLFGILMTPSTFLIPSFLEQMAGFKALQSKDATMIIFITYLMSMPFVIYLAKKIEARYMIILGALLIMIAGTYGLQLTQEWRVTEFLLLLIIQALGESVFLLGLIAAFVTNLNPAHGVILGAYIPLARICAPIFSSTIMLFWLRQQKEKAIALFAENIDSAVLLEDQVQIFPLIEKEALVHAYIDSFLLVVAIAIVALMLALCLKPAPQNPIAPPYLPR